MPRARIINNTFTTTVKAPATVKELAEMARTATDVSTRLRTMVAKAKADISKNRAEVDAKLVGLPSSAVGQVKEALMSAHRDWRRNYLEQTEPARVTLRKELKALQDGVARSKALFQNDREYIATVTLGDPRKQALIEELRELSGDALKALAQRSVDTGDRVLAAALVKVVGDMDRPNRPFPPGELAQAHADSELVEAENLYRQIEVTAIKAEQDVRELQSGQRSGLDTLRAALLQEGAGDGRPNSMKPKPKAEEKDSEEDAA